MTSCAADTPSASNVAPQSRRAWKKRQAISTGSRRSPVKSLESGRLLSAKPGDLSARDLHCSSIARCRWRSTPISHPSGRSGKSVLGVLRRMTQFPFRDERPVVCESQEVLLAGGVGPAPSLGSLATLSKARPGLLRMELRPTCRIASAAPPARGARRSPSRTRSPRRPHDGENARPESRGWTCSANHTSSTSCRYTFARIGEISAHFAHRERRYRAIVSARFAAS